MATIKVKRHDCGRAIEDQLEWAGTPMDLTGATVRLLLKNGATVNARSANVTDAVAGRVSYFLQQGDTERCGVWLFEWEVTFPGGAIQTVPDDVHHRLIIVEDLG